MFERASYISDYIITSEREPIASENIQFVKNIQPLINNV